MTAQSLPYLSEEALENLGISTRDVIAAIEGVIRGSSEETVWAAPKAAFLTPDGRYMMAALAAMDGPSLLAVKTVVLNPRNSEQGLPQINGLVTMLNSQTGLPEAILDGNWITAVRTAGLSATAANRLARADSSSVGFVGCGVQAKSHLRAFHDLFPLERIKLFGRGQANIDSLSQLASELGLAVEVCASGREAIEEVDLVVTSVTYSPGLEPFLDAHWMKPGSFAAITDLSAPWIQESFSALDRIIIDDVAQEAALPNKLVPEGLVHGDLTGLVLGKVEGRESPAQRTTFNFRGHALGDLALSALAYQKYQQS